jgi:glutamate--cysteine ligase
MERFFEGFGPAGRRMMCRTAALQVNVDVGAGDAQDAERRWRLAHLIGPALSASFATSPVAEGDATGWSSTRLATWLAIDPTRTAAVRGGRDAFVTYALDANVMLVRRHDAFEPIAERLSFADWVRDGHALGRATADDLDYHLTTLFPPVRPRRWMEIRYLDALPDPWWRVAAAVVTTVLDDADAGAAAEAACAPCAARWCASARYGLADPAFRRAALATVLAARDAFDRVGVSASIGRSCDDFVTRYVEPGRSIGDDVLDAWRAGRPLVAALEDLEDAWT